MLFAGRSGGVAPLGKRTVSSESPVDWTSNRRYMHADARKGSQSQPRNKTKSPDPFSRHRLDSSTCRVGSERTDLARGGPTKAAAYKV